MIEANDVLKNSDKQRVCNVLLIAVAVDRHHMFFCGRCGEISYENYPPTRACSHPHVDRYSLEQMSIPDLLAFEQMLLNAIECGAMRFSR